MAAAGVPKAFGNAREAGTFYSALVPKQHTAVAPKALVPITDTILLVRGRIVRWLCGSPSGEASEKLSTDRDAILRVFRDTGA